jgi:hypothetical protein
MKSWSRLELLSRLGFGCRVILEDQSDVMKLASCRGVEVWSGVTIEKLERNPALMALL